MITKDDRGVEVRDQRIFANDKEHLFDKRIFAFNSLGLKAHMYIYLFHGVYFSDEKSRKLVLVETNSGLDFIKYFSYVLLERILLYYIF